MKNLKEVRRNIALILIAAIYSLLFIGSPALVLAKNPVDCASGRVDSSGNCVPLGNDCNGGSAQDCLTKNPIVVDLNKIVDFLSALVGIVVVGTIIVGGIQYSMSNGSNKAAEEAKKRISNGVLALITFLLAFAFLQWLIPGGL